MSLFFRASPWFSRLSLTFSRSFCSSEVGSAFNNSSRGHYGEGWNDSLSILQQNRDLKHEILWSEKVSRDLKTQNRDLERENVFLKTSYVSKEDINRASELIGLTFNAPELLDEYVGDIYMEAQKKGIEPFSPGVKFVYQSICGELDMIFGESGLTKVKGQGDKPKLGIYHPNKIQKCNVNRYMMATNPFDNRIEEEIHPLDVILYEIKHATTSIDVAMAFFNDVGVAEEIVEAKNRGVSVRVLVGSLASTYFEALSTLRTNGVFVRATPGRAPHGIFHPKTIIIDCSKVIDGSYNLSPNARRNSIEWSGICEGKEFAQSVEKIFSYWWCHKETKAVESENGVLKCN